MCRHMPCVIYSPAIEIHGGSALVIPDSQLAAREGCGWDVESAQWCSGGAEDCTGIISRQWGDQEEQHCCLWLIGQIMGAAAAEFIWVWTLGEPEIKQGWAAKHFVVRFLFNRPFRLSKYWSDPICIPWGKTPKCLYCLKSKLFKRIGGNALFLLLDDTFQVDVKGYVPCNPGLIPMYTLISPIHCK